MNDIISTYESELQAVKEREGILLRVIDRLEAERRDIYGLIVDGNRCANCLNLEACKQKNAKNSTYKLKKYYPEAFCANWIFNGKYTPVDDIRLGIRTERRE